LRNVADVDAVEAHGAGGRAVLPQQELGQRGLAASGRADERDALARIYLNADAAEHLGRIARRVGEAYVLKLDAALGDSGHGGGVIERRGRRRPVPFRYTPRQVKRRRASAERVLDPRPLVAHVKRGPVHEGGVEREAHHLVGIEGAARNSLKAERHRCYCC
jgi:hypothetical protein